MMRIMTFDRAHWASQRALRDGRTQGEESCADEAGYWQHWCGSLAKVSADSWMTSDPNRLDDLGYIERLVKQVVAGSVKTVEQGDELAQAVTMEDWLPTSKTPADEAPPTKATEKE